LVSTTNVYFAIVSSFAGLVATWEMFPIRGVFRCQAGWNLRRSRRPDNVGALYVDRIYVKNSRNWSARARKHRIRPLQFTDGRVC
jgi:hypothetical protein